MGLKELYGTDQNLENDGAWVEFRGGVQIRVRSENSVKVREYANRMLKKQRQLYLANNGILPPQLADKNDVDLCANAIVTDWKGVTDENDKDLPCTPENIAIVMRAFAALRRDVMFAARVDETFRAQQEEAAGNSAKS